jgi:hypothetical protein
MSTITNSNGDNEVILALQKERKNQYESYKKHGGFFQAMNGGSTNSKSFGITALGVCYLLILVSGLMLYVFVDVIDGKNCALLVIAAMFVVRVHPAFKHNQNKKG